MKLIITIIFFITSTFAFADEEPSFWSNVDKFLGKIADGVSKKDAITGLRTFDSPFHNEKHFRKQGQKTLELILNKAKKDSIRIFEPVDPEFIRVKRIVDRLVRASHYRNHIDKVKYAVIDYEDFNALAFGSGYFVVFSGLMKQTNDDELAYVIAHELAHNTAGHIEESYFLKAKDVFGDKPSSAYTTAFTNVNEQEADRVAIIYTALAGFDPRGSATIWEKQFQGIEQYAFYRSHPANPQRVKANRFASKKVMKYFTRGVVNPDVEKILKCNELFCNTSLADLSKDGSGGGVLKSLEVIGDLYIKNKQAKEEKKKQEQEIAQAKRLLAKKKLLTPPNVKWDNSVALKYQGTINRHNQKSGLNFAFTQNLSQGKFYYNFNNKIEQGNIVFTGTNQHGYWFKWNDKYGQGNLQLREYTDGSLRGVIYIDDGTMLGKKLGDFIGFRK
ncbi:M48 family metallopeptidase [Alphaproteobacteria bacterium]|nr:M48 family metallopeptidase [Alphaproteobacteria bacterium]